VVWRVAAVTVFIGLLLTVGVRPFYFAQVGKSQVATVRAQIDALNKALDQFRIDVGHHPTSEEGLQALVVQPSGEPNWAGPYLKEGRAPRPMGPALRLPAVRRARCREGSGRNRSPRRSDADAPGGRSRPSGPASRDRDPLAGSSAAKQQPRLGALSGWVAPGWPYGPKRAPQGRKRSLNTIPAAHGQKQARIRGHADPPQVAGSGGDAMPGPCSPAASPSASSSPPHRRLRAAVPGLSRCVSTTTARSGPGIRGTSIGATDAARGTDSARTSSGRRRGWERARAPARGGPSG